MIKSSPKKRPASVSRRATFLAAAAEKPRLARLLVVEDNEGDVRLLKEALREADFDGQLFVVNNGEDAIRYLKKQGKYRDSPRPDITLLDLNLPRKGGREVLAEIKKDAKLRRIPVIILSTSTRPEDIDTAYDLHANCYVSKPTDLGKLVELGKAIEEFWLRLVTRSQELRRAV